MVSELLEVISVVALLLIAIQLSLLVMLKRREARSAVIRRTHEEIYRNDHYRRLLTEVVARSLGTEWDVDRLMTEGNEFSSNATEALNYCEYLSLGVVQGVFDERLVRAAYGTLMYVMYSHFQKVIHELRLRSNNPETFRYFTALVERWRANT